MAQKRTAPLSVRLSQELNSRLEECAEKLRVKKHSLAQDAIEAAVDAIEKNDYRLVVPIEFEVSHVPAKKPAPGQFPARQVETAALNEEQIAPHPSSSSETRDTVRKYARALRKKYSPEKDDAPPRK